MREINTDDSNSVISRKDWGKFSVGSQVEIRAFHFASTGAIFRGYISNDGFHRKYTASEVERGVYVGHGKYNNLDSVKAFIVDKKRHNFSVDTVEVIIEIEDYISDADIVLTTYNCLRNGKMSKVFQSFQWHRIVLDECQEIKVATNQIAKLCANLTSERRWMVSGTPLCTNVSDLHGELNFLKVWPFCLPNTVDGFWELLVDHPWRNNDELALTMLYALLDVVMMRHCKNQRNLITDAPLVELPSLSVEWRGFDQRNSIGSMAYNGDTYRDRDSMLYAYQYLEAFAADAVQRFVESNNLAAEASHDQWMASPQAAQLKGFYSILSRCLTHPSAVSLSHVDHLRRMLGDVRGIMQGMRDASRGHCIPALSPEDILSIVQGIDSERVRGILGGNINHESSRVQASVAAHEAEEQLRNSFMEMTVAELAEQVTKNGLPRPITWTAVPYVGSINKGSSLLSMHPLPSECVEKYAGDEFMSSRDNVYTSPNSLHDHLAIGDIIRICSARNEESECSVVSVCDNMSDPHHIIEPGSDHICSQVVKDDNYDTSSGLGFVKINAQWQLGNEKLSKVFRRNFSRRKVQYVDLLVANAHTLNMRQHLSENVVLTQNGQRNGLLHAGGFSTIYKLMAGVTPNCPLCLSECSRPTVTSCVHVYCFDCITSVIHRERMESNCSFRPQQLAKCPVCRQHIEFSSLIEVKEQSMTEKFDKVEVDDEGEENEKEAVEHTIYTSNTNIISSSCPLPNHADAVDITKEAVGSSCDCSDMDGGQGLQFIIPALDCTSVAVTSDDIKQREERATRQQYHCPLPLRDVNLPSISRYAISVFRRHGRKLSLDLSPRLIALLEDIKQTQKSDPFSKFVIFSQYKESLQVAHDLLSDDRVFEQCQLYQPLNCTIMKRHHDGDHLKRFYVDPLCNVLFLTLSAASSGLTLTMAKTLYILEPTPSAVDEAQAISRIHRIGQTSHQVRCVVFYAMNSCEERLLALRMRSKMLSEILASNLYTTLNDDTTDSDTQVYCKKRRSQQRGGRLARNVNYRGTNNVEHFFSCSNLKTLFGATNRNEAS